MIKKLGSHPDKPYPANTLEQAFEFNKRQFVCPQCGKKGNQEFNSHATIYRKKINGEMIFLDVHHLICGHCNASNVVFFTPYTHWWRDKKGGILEPIKEMAIPNEGYCFLSGFKTDPQAWFPTEFRAGKVVDPFSNKLIAGPVLIHSLPAQNLEHDENGCGHTQFLIIGPTIQKIYEKMKRTPEIVSSICQNSNCVICGRSLKNVFVVADEEDFSSERIITELHRGFPCEFKIVLAKPKSSRKYLTDFGTDRLNLAVEQVVIYNDTMVD